MADLQQIDFNVLGHCSGGGGGVGEGGGRGVKPQFCNKYDIQKERL